MGIFGMSKKEAWQLLCQETGAHYIDGGFWKSDWVEYDVGYWKIVLDTYVVSTGKVTVTYTRLRVQYAVYRDFEFKMYRNGIFRGIDRFFSAQDLLTGDQRFDAEFTIKGEDHETLLRLAGDPMLRSLLFEQHTIDLDAHNGKGFWKNSLPDGINELSYRESGIINDVPRLIGLLQLFARVLIVMMDLGLVKPEEIDAALP